ncbi:MAG: undecaprenyl/decaprenyl-phosphate alpha-N-acetylglucosaminyl 1-phosphate transferase [Desulfobacterales bacterium]|nr:undecaprenyl/decaprenyl-phosphate alpha-N-acetylglucosaminyl 1-phosphate transferase [Desulfobacterales bacterium]
MPGSCCGSLPADWGIWGLIGNLLLTGLWIIGITNAMNFFDGMDGLAAGLGAIIAFFLGVVAFQTDQPFFGWISLAVLGGCLGFLPYNFRPSGSAVIFLGDAGSTVIGFVLACIAVYGDWAEGQPVVSLVSPVLIFWLLIFDMAHITCRPHSQREGAQLPGMDRVRGQGPPAPPPGRRARQPAQGGAFHLPDGPLPGAERPRAQGCRDGGCHAADPAGRHPGGADHRP